MLCYFSAMRVHFIFEGQFERSVDDDDNNSTISQITGYFHTFPVVLTEGESELDLANLIAGLDLSGGWEGLTPHWLKMTPTLVTENFCLGGSPQF